MGQSSIKNISLPKIKTLHASLYIAAAATAVIGQCTGFIAETHKNPPLHRLGNITIQKRTLSGKKD